MKIVAVDDEPLALELVKSFCYRISFLDFHGGFSKTRVALECLQENDIDLLLLDINMPAMNGIDFYKSLNKKPMLIFTTSYSEFALESYDLSAVDYLLKPFTFQRFETAIIKAYDRHKTKHASVPEKPGFIMFKADYGVVKVSLSQILFIEGLDNYLKIHIKNQPSIVVRMTMKAMVEKLGTDKFVRVHKSYIVAIENIESFKFKIINICGEEIPVSNSYENDLKSVIEKFSR